MKKITCLLAALLLTCGLSWAQTISWTAADQGYENGQVIESVDFDDYVSAEFFKGSNNNAPKYYTTGTAIRCYGGNYFTVTSDYLLTEIVLTFSSGEGTNAITTDCGDYANGTWTGSANEVTFTIGGTSGHRRIAAFDITYTEGGTPAPTITANDVEIAYDATSGVVEYTINNPADDGVLTATTTAEWLTIGEVGEDVPFTCTVNEDGAAREGTITLTYTYNRETINKNVTVTQAGNPNALNNISDITAAGSYAVQGTIVAKSQRGFIVGDGTGYVYYYNQNYVQDDYNIGDMVKLAGNVVAYGGVFEFNSSTTVTPANSSNYVAEDPTVITGEEMDARVASTNPAQLSNYVQYEGTLSVSGSYYNITNIEGATTAKGSISYPIDTEFAELNGKHVIVKGYYVGISSSKYYNTMIGTVEEVVVTEPSVTVTPATLNVDAEEHEGTLAITYENIPELISFDFYFCDAEGNELQEAPDWIDAEIQEEDDVYSVYYLIDANDGDARTAYFKVYTFAGDELEEVYAIVTVNQAEYVAPALDYAELPFEFDGTLSDVEGTDGLTQEGLGNYASAPHLKFDSTGDWLLLHFLERPGTLTFNIKNNSFSGGTFTVQTSEDGETFIDLENYTEISGTQAEEFNNLGENVRYIKWIYTEKVSGNVGLGNITLAEYTGPTPTITVDPDMVEVDAEEHDGTLGLTYENLTITDMTDFDIQYYDAEGLEAEEPDWIEVLVAEQDPEIGEGYVVSYYMIENEGEARTAYFKVYALDDEINLVYSNLVTVNQAAYQPPFTGATYTLATAIESGRHYIITNGNDRAMGAQNVSSNGSQGNNRTAVEITTVEGVAQVSSPDVVEFVINGPDAAGNYFIYDASYDASFYGYLYAASSSANQLKTEEFLDANGNGLWTITFDEENNNAVITAQGDHTRNLMRYNSGSDIFACYSGGQQDIYLYMKDEDETYEFFKDIVGYGEGDGDYYLVATPFDDVDPASVNMFTYDYDLYYFDQTATGEEWQNYKANPFNLAMGMGYLYASKQNVTLHFQGESIFDEASVELPLENVGDNLIGNPYACIANVEGDFYIVNEDGTDVTLSNRTYVNPMEGIFVEAQTEGQAFTFAKNTGAGGSGFEPGGSFKLDLKVNDNNGRGDLARIRFGEGNDLHKFMINPANTKLYIPTEDADYAVVYADNMGEMPVNFSAAVDGTYTLTVDAGDMEMDYLHLIDNMTGMDVNLLANPSYSFEATVNDNAARFTLVFAHLTGIEENNTNTFAFFSNGNFIIANQGNATLQVVDLNGRILKSEVISDSASVNVDAAPGVYMIRLINGDNVKVQKIVVR